MRARPHRRAAPGRAVTRATAPPSCSGSLGGAAGRVFHIRILILLGPSAEPDAQVHGAVLAGDDGGEAVAVAHGGAGRQLVALDSADGDAG